jgi:hypothetical protein
MMCLEFKPRAEKDLAGSRSSKAVSSFTASCTDVTLTAKETAT